MACFEEERKPMLPLKTLDIIFRRRYLPNTQFYFTDRKHAVDIDKIKQKPPRPFRVPKSEKLLSYIKYSDKMEKVNSRNRLSQALFLKDNFRIEATRDVSKRLFIEEVPSDIRAIVDVDAEFYGTIEGRPIRCFDDVKVYINNIRSYAMSRQQIGYRQDLILRIEQNLVDETVEYDLIVEKLRQHIKDFQKFLTEDYKKACAKVTKTEKVYAELLAKNIEFLAYVSSLTLVNNVLFKLDAIRGTLKIYRRFLMFVAPLSWRQQYDETLKGKLQSIQFESGAFMTDNDLVETPDIDKMIEMAKKEFANPLPVRMYFKSPQEIVYLFRSMELQSREYLMHLSKTGAPFKLLQDRIKQLKQATKQELDYFQYYIDSVNDEITRENHNEAGLQEKFFRILNGVFFETVASPTTLKLKICIEYVYEQVYGKCEEGHQSLRDPMKILEIMYEDYNLRLDSLDFKVVNQARNDFFAQDLKVMKDALLAQRELKAFREMTEAMNRAFLEPKKYTRPVLKKFMDRKTKTAVEKAERKKTAVVGDCVKPKKYKLSKEEQEGLLLFTEWCDGMNPAPYLSEYYRFAKPVFQMPRKSTVDRNTI